MTYPSPRLDPVPIDYMAELTESRLLDVEQAMLVCVWFERGTSAAACSLLSHYSHSSQHSQSYHAGRSSTVRCTGFHDDMYGRLRKGHEQSVAMREGQ